MALIFIAGPSGTGKSTVCNELTKRGYEAHDTDEDGMSAWYNNQTLQLVERPEAEDRPTDWYEKHDYRMSSDRVKALAEKAKDKLIFLCGIPANDIEFLDYYDKVFCLFIDKDTLKHRILNRKNNDFGQSSDELKTILFWHDKIIQRYRNLSAHMIDSNRPISIVVDEIISNLNNN